MSFSAFNVGRDMIALTSNKSPALRLSSRPVAGGSFTPTTLEAAFVLRSGLDYQWEKAFIDQHRAKMQNRLNELVKQLQEAYTDLLNVSMSQQIGENAALDMRSDVRLDGNGVARLIEGIGGANGFEDLGVRPDSQASVNFNAPGAGNVGDNIWRTPYKLPDRLNGNTGADDGLMGYGRAIGSTEVQFRALTEQTTAGGNMGGDLSITMRIEDDPPVPPDLNGSLAFLNQITSAILGGPPPPTYFNQKVEQHETNFKTGGFWSTVNYLNNFAPRELVYTYAVGYTVNSDEAGDTSYLINGELVNVEDIPFGMHPDDPNYLDPDYAYPATTSTAGHRVKWASFDPTEGYQLELSGSSQRYTTVVNRQKAWFVDDPEFNSIGNELWRQGATAADGEVAVVDGLIFQSGTYTYRGQFINEFGVGNAVGGTTLVGGTVVQTQANNNGTLVDLTESNIQLGTIFKHKVDMQQNGTTDNTTGPSASDPLVINARGALRSSLFFNHYIVETRTVEFNNSDRKDVPDMTNTPTPTDLSDDGTGKIYVHGSLERSHSVDASKAYDRVVEPGSPPGTVGDISRSAGNVSSSFNGEFIQSLHRIESFNGQNVVGNDPKKAAPILGGFEVGRYEGVLRSFHMGRNIIDYVPPSKMEVNAANAVPTDWYQGEITSVGSDPGDANAGYIWFPLVRDTLYAYHENDVAGGPGGYGRLGAPRQLIQARNTFNLTQDDLMELRPVNGPANDGVDGWIRDASGVLRPTYDKKEFNVNVDLTGIHYNALDAREQPKIFVNGREVTAIPTVTVVDAAANVANVSYSFDMGPFLQTGLNSISIQASDGTFVPALGNTNYNEGIRVTAGPVGVGPGNNMAEVNDILNASVITGYSDVRSAVYAPEFQRPGTQKVQSRWQTRVVPTTAELDTNNTLIDLSSRISTTGSSNKQANSFVEILNSIMNQEKYRDIFRLGLMSNLNQIAVTGQANLPNGASLEGAMSVYYDQLTQQVIVFQDKLIANS